MEKIKYTINEVVDLQLLKKTKPGEIILGLNKDGKVFYDGVEEKYIIGFLKAKGK